MTNENMIDSDLHFLIAWPHIIGVGSMGLITLKNRISSDVYFVKHRMLQNFFTEFQFWLNALWHALLYFYLEHRGKSTKKKKKKNNHILRALSKI